jgi:hypothetical protein
MKNKQWVARRKLKATVLSFEDVTTGIPIHTKEYIRFHPFHMFLPRAANIPTASFGS